MLLSPRSWATVIAVLAEEGSGEVATVLEAELAKHTELKLIDRTQITRVMAGQKLTALQKPESAVQLGRLVGADGVLLVSQLKVAGKPILAARLVATTPGVVLWSIMHPAEVFEPWTNAVAGRAGDSAAKLTVRQGDATAIAILNLRAAVKNIPSLRTVRDRAVLPKLTVAGKNKAYYPSFCHSSSELTSRRDQKWFKKCRKNWIIT